MRPRLYFLKRKTRDIQRGVEVLELFVSNGHSPVNQTLWQVLRLVSQRTVLHSGARNQFIVMFTHYCLFGFLEGYGVHGIKSMFVCACFLLMHVWQSLSLLSVCNCVVRVCMNKHVYIYIYVFCVCMCVLVLIVSILKGENVCASGSALHTYMIVCLCVPSCLLYVSNSCFVGLMSQCSKGDLQSQRQRITLLVAWFHWFTGHSLQGSRSHSNMGQLTGSPDGWRPPLSRVIPDARCIHLLMFSLCQANALEEAARLMILLEKVP